MESPGAIWKIPIVNGMMLKVQTERYDKQKYVKTSIVTAFYFIILRPDSRNFSTTCTTMPHTLITDEEDVFPEKKTLLKYFLVKKSLSFLMAYFKK